MPSVTAVAGSQVHVVAVAFAWHDIISVAGPESVACRFSTAPPAREFVTDMMMLEYVAGQLVTHGVSSLLPQAFSATSVTESWQQPARG